MTEQMESKIDEMADHLCEHGTIHDLRQQHMKLFGIASKSKNKQRLSRKIARELMVREAQSDGGNGASEAGSQVEVEAPDLEAGPDEEQTELAASAALIRVKAAWDEVKELKKQRKEKKAEQTKVIADHTDAIDDVLSSDDGAEERVNQLENHWRIIKRARDKRASISEEYGERIKTASTAMEKELGNVRQGVLPFDFTEDDEDDD